MNIQFKRLQWSKIWSVRRRGTGISVKTNEKMHDEYRPYQRLAFEESCFVHYLELVLKIQLCDNLCVCVIILGENTVFDNWFHNFVSLACDLL